MGWDGMTISLLAQKKGAIADAWTRFDKQQTEREEEIRRPGRKIRTLSDEEYNQMMKQRGRQQDAELFRQRFQRDIETLKDTMDTHVTTGIIRFMKEISTPADVESSHEEYDRQIQEISRRYTLHFSSDSSRLTEERHRKFQELCRKYGFEVPPDDDTEEYTKLVQPPLFKKSVTASEYCLNILDNSIALAKKQGFTVRVALMEKITSKESSKEAFISLVTGLYLQYGGVIHARQLGLRMMAWYHESNPSDTIPDDVRRVLADADAAAENARKLAG